MKRLNIILLLLSILVICILLLIRLTQKKESFENFQNIEFVISRYNESLDWTDKEPFNKYPIVLYNKGNNTDYNNNNIIKTVNLPNVGKCDHTYLYHIIHNYDNLADITVFLPGSADMSNKYFRAVKVVETAEEHRDTSVMCDKYSDVKKDLYNFTMDTWETSYDKNKEINPDKTIKKSSIRPFGKWFESKFGDLHIEYVTYTGIFAISKDDILQHPKSYYESFIKELENDVNPEVGHYIERSWMAIFNPMKNPEILISHTPT